MKDYRGQAVEFKDAAKLKHSGIIVGMTDDKQWYLIQSDRPTAPKAAWHFKVRASEIESYLKHGS